MGKIVVIGSANTDLVVKTDRMPSPGETILGGSFMMSGGGKGANQAVAASRLGGEVTFVARVVTICSASVHSRATAPSGWTCAM